MIDSGSPPEFVTVTDCVAETCPADVAAKVSDAGLTVSAGAAAPVPFSGTVCVPAESVKVSRPFTAPACTGAKATETWQLALAASVAVQEFDESTNGAVAATFEIDTEAVRLRF